MAFVLIALVSYFLGSIPSGYLAGRMAGVDIRKIGSGNIGATNVTRALGKRYGYPVFAADLAKGFTAVCLGSLIGRRFSPNESHLLFQIVAAIFCVVGNTFPCWLQFKGGKGVATSAGALFAMIPLATTIAVVVWLITFEITRYVSLASIVAAVGIPVTILVLSHFERTNESLLFYFSLCLAAIVILRHRSNIVRLIQGTEQRFERREN